MGFKLDKFFSGRFLTTLLLTLTYCVILVGVANTGCKLMLLEKDVGEKIVTFIIGNLTGTAMGAVIAYHFRQDRVSKGGA